MEINLLPIIAAYLILAVCFIIYEYRFIKKTKTIKIITLCRGMFILMVVVFPMLIFFGHYAYNIGSYIRFGKSYTWTFVASFLCIVISYISLNVGYNLKSHKDMPQKYITGRERVGLVVSIYLIVGIVSLIMWASGYGGLSNLIENASMARSHRIETTGNVLFMKRFVPLTLLGSYFAFANMISAETKSVEKIKMLILIGGSVYVSVLYILANDGRMLAGMFLMLFALIWFKYKTVIEGEKATRYTVIIIVASVFALILIFNADNIFRTLRGVETRVDEDASMLETIRTEFQFIPASLQYALISRDNGTVELTLLNDLVNGMFAWLPSSLKLIELPDVWNINTHLIGVKYGQFPTSLPAQAYYNLSVAGVVLIPAVYGYFIRFIESYLESFHNSHFFISLYIVIGFYLAKGVAYYSLFNIMINMFYIVPGWIIYYIINKKRIKFSRNVL